MIDILNLIPDTVGPFEDQKLATVQAIRQYVDGGELLAENIAVDTSNFDDILSPADDTVQKALDTLDDHRHDYLYDVASQLGSINVSLISTIIPGGESVKRAVVDINLAWLENNLDLDEYVPKVGGFADRMTGPLYISPGIENGIRVALQAGGGYGNLIHYNNVGGGPYRTTVGSGGLPLSLQGSELRPRYGQTPVAPGGVELALLSDVPQLPTLDDRYVNVAGDTMEGVLIFHRDTGDYIRFTPPFSGGPAWELNDTIYGQDGITRQTLGTSISFIPTGGSSFQFIDNLRGGWGMEIIPNSWDDYVHLNTIGGAGSFRFDDPIEVSGNITLRYPYSARALLSNLVPVNVYTIGVGNRLSIGDSGVPLDLFGSETRPNYQGNDLALLSDLAGAVSPAHDHDYVDYYVESVTNGDPVNPEMMFDLDGDIVTIEVPVTRTTGPVN
jgi:hypothetical protein